MIFETRPKTRLILDGESTLYLKRSLRSSVAFLRMAGSLKTVKTRLLQFVKGFSFEGFREFKIIKIDLRSRIYYENNLKIEIRNKDLT